MEIGQTFRPVSSATLDVYEILVARLEEICCSFSEIIDEMDETKATNRYRMRALSRDRGPI